MNSEAVKPKSTLLLPESLVVLVLKIGQKFKIDLYNIFSILDTLSYGLEENFKLMKNDQAEFCEKEMTMLVINILRLSEKFNKSSAKVFKVHIDEAFQNLGIDRDLINSKEIEHFKSFNYEVKNPAIAEALYQLIDNHLDAVDKKDYILSVSFDILRLFYCWRTRIYDEVTKSTMEVDARKMLTDINIVGISILIVALKLLNTSERVYNTAFDSMCNELKDTDYKAKDLNALSGIIFGYLKK